MEYKKFAFTCEEVCSILKECKSSDVATFKLDDTGLHVNFTCKAPGSVEDRDKLAESLPDPEEVANLEPQTLSDASRREIEEANTEILQDFTDAQLMLDDPEGWEAKEIDRLREMTKGEAHGGDDTG